MEPNNPIAPLDPAVAAHHERTKREMERRKLDRCKVHNPTEHPFTITYNGYQNSVAPHKDEVFFRYIAEPFMTKLVDKILTDTAEAEVKKVNAEREERGQAKLVRMDKNEIYANPDYNINNINARRPWIQQIWKGVVEEYGMQNMQTPQAPKHVDLRPLDEQLIDEIDKANLVAAEDPIPPASPPPPASSVPAPALSVSPPPPTPAPTLEELPAA